MPVAAVLLPLVGVIALATLGFVAVGTLFGALVIRTRFAELLLVVILLPFLIPPLIGAVQVTARLLGGRPLSEAGGWLRLLAAYDIAFVTLAIMLDQVGLPQTLKLAVMIWLIAPLPLLVTNALFIKIDPLVTASHSAGWLVKLLLIAVATAVLI